MYPVGGDHESTDRSSLPAMPTEAHDLPTHLTLRFAPPQLPSGAVDVHDLSQFLMGLQRTLDAKVRHDLKVDNIESEQFAVYRLVLGDVREGSVLLDIYFNIFSGNSIYITAPASVTIVGGLAAVKWGPALIQALANGAAQETGKKAVQQVADHMVPALRAYLRDFVAFLRNAASPNPTPIDSNLLDKAEPGLRDMVQVGAKDMYGEEGIIVSTDAPNDKPVVFNRQTRSRVLDLLDTEVAGENLLTARGRVTVLDTEQNSFRLRDLERNRPLRCRYDEVQENTVVAVASPPNWVVAEGIPHYRKGSDRTGPPLYLKVNDVWEMTTLWNMSQQAQ